MWKTAFWICFALLIATLVFGFYSILDQGVTITYQRDSYLKTEADLKALIEVARKTPLTRDELSNVLRQTKGSGSFLVKGDTLFLNRIEFVFNGERLNSITDRW